MVSPSWESFEKVNPNQQNQQMINSEEKEFDEELSGQLKDEKKPEGEKPQWGNFQSPSTYQGEPNPIEEEGILGYTIRNISANASRLGEQYFGRAGNLEKFGKNLLTNIPKSGGLIGWALSELLGPEKWETLVKGPEEQQQLLPTSENLKEISEKLTGGYTKPKTKGEEKFQGFTEDVWSTLTGRTFRQPTVRNIGINNILIPAAANITKKIVEDTGFGTDKANLAKLAIWLPLSLAANISAPAFAANLMNQGRNGFNANLTANVPRYQGSITQAGRNFLHGDPRSELAQQQLVGIERDIQQGKTTMRDLMNRYDAINAAKRNRGLFDLNREDRNAAIRNINQVRDVVRNEIETLGQANPQALQSWQNGVNAFSTIHRSNAISNWIESVASGPYAKMLSGPAASIFGISAISAYKGPLVGISTAATSAAAYKTGKTIYRMWNDENLARYYWQSLEAATEQNLPTFINNYNKLNKKLEKLDSVEKKASAKKY